jgi:hypothetical protein
MEPFKIASMEAVAVAEQRQTSFADRFRPVKERAASFDGMISDLSIAIFQSLLDFQAEQSFEGDFIEFGTYKGRSASVLLSNLPAANSLGLVDIATYAEFDKLRLISDRFEFFRGKSEELTSDPSLLKFISRGIRFSHHDASHTYVNVSAEMLLMEPTLVPGGLMVLDDFANPAFMQVVAACFNHLERADSQLEVFLFADNKAYLCKSSDFPLYASFVVRRLLGDLKEAGFDCAIARTSKVQPYRAFSVTRKKSASEPDFYGLNTYGDQFYKV